MLNIIYQLMDIYIAVIILLIMFIEKKLHLKVSAFIVSIPFILRALKIK